MKFLQLLSVLLLMFLLLGCTQPAAAPSESKGNENTPSAQASSADKLIPEEEAKNIALQHAGFTADQVTGLRISLDYDDGIPEYDVHFREGFLEYEYEIHAKTGQILSFEKDD